MKTYIASVLWNFVNIFSLSYVEKLDKGHLHNKKGKIKISVIRLLKAYDDVFSYS